MLIGYARVSTTDQNLNLQKTALLSSGIEEKYIFSDMMSGSRSDRPGLDAALSHCRPGDTLVVWKLDRLGRSIKSLIDLVSNLNIQGIHFRSLTDSIDTSTTSGKFFFHVMAALAEMERDLIRERTKAGLNAAAAKGKKGGRKKVMDESKIASARALLSSGIAPRDVAKNLGVSVATLYRYLPADKQ